MKEPIEIDNGNILKYPKTLFTEEDVIEEKKHMGTPSAWVLWEDDKNYYLKFSERIYDWVHKHRKSEKIPEFIKI